MHIKNLIPDTRGKEIGRFTLRNNKMKAVKKFLLIEGSFLRAFFVFLQKKLKGSDFMKKLQLKKHFKNKILQEREKT